MHKEKNVVGKTLGEKGGFPLCNLTGIVLGRNLRMAQVQNLANDAYMVSHGEDFLTSWLSNVVRVCSRTNVETCLGTGRREGIF